MRVSPSRLTEGRGPGGTPEGKACRQFFAPEGGLDLPSGFAKNGDTIACLSDYLFGDIPLGVSINAPRSLRSNTR